MGPLRSPSAWKMKGGENRNKKRKQLWQDRGQWQRVGGSRPEGAPVCQDSAAGGWASPKIASSAWVVPTLRVSRSTPCPSAPLVPP